jgi:hypothetical protein
MFSKTVFTTLCLVLSLSMMSSVAFAVDAPPGAIVLEAEDATQADAGVTILDVDGASGGKAIDSARDAQASHEIEIPQAGQWHVWIRVNFPDGGSDSYWIGIDGATPNPHDAAGGEGAVKIYSEAGDSTNTADQPFNIWYWDAGVQSEPPGNRFFDIPAAGTYTVWSKGREPGSLLDQILLTPDDSFDAEEASNGEAFEIPTVPTAVDSKDKLAVTWARLKTR